MSTSGPDGEPASIRRRDLRGTPPTGVDSDGPSTPPRAGGLVRAVLRSIATGVSAAALIFFAAIGVAAIIVPAVTGSTALTVVTSSMEPALPPGTMVVVRPTPIDEIKPGMVLTYQLRSGEPTLVTHRVQQRQELADGEVVFITRGDANNQPDQDPVREVQIRGTVWYAIPFIGWVTNGVTGDVRALVIPVIVVGLLAYAVWMAISALRDRRRSRATSDGTATDG